MFKDDPKRLDHEISKQTTGVKDFFSENDVANFRTNIWSNEQVLARMQNGLVDWLRSTKI